MSAVLNPKGNRYDLLQKTFAVEYEDNYWAEDAIYMERNSRDFVSRIHRVNCNAGSVCEKLRAHPKGKLLTFGDVRSDNL
jgi:cystathionine gamma-synthase